MLAKPLAVTSAHRYYIHILIVCIPLSKLSLLTVEPQSWLVFIKHEMMWWQRHQLDNMQITCNSLQTDNHASMSSLYFLQVRRSSWCSNNSVKAVPDYSKNCDARCYLPWKFSQKTSEAFLS